MNLTYKMIKKAVEQLKKNGYKDEYIYKVPSPNDGKLLVIRGPVGPWQAAEMFTDVWNGKSKIEDCPYMQEVDSMLDIIGRK